MERQKERKKERKSVEESSTKEAVRAKITLSEKNSFSTCFKFLQA